MKRRILIPLISATVLLSAVSAILFFEVRSANGKISFYAGQSAYYEEKLARQEKQLEKFEGVDFAQLKQMCHEKAKAAYSKYIADNSIATKIDLVTTFYPKSPTVVKDAQKALDTAQGECETKFPV